MITKFRRYLTVIQIGIFVLFGFDHQNMYQTSTTLAGRRQLTWPVFGFDFIACFLR